MLHAQMVDVCAIRILFDVNFVALLSLPYPNSKGFVTLDRQSYKARDQ